MVNWDAVDCDRGSFSVAVCLLDRAFGGPEEGGWWYDTGAPVTEYARLVRGFRSYAAALAYEARLNRHLCKRLNVGRPSISSVLCNGVYEAAVFSGLPAAWPSVRPSYE